MTLVDPMESGGEFQYMTTTSTITEHWSITYTHDTGPVVAEFHAKLKERKLLARNCPICKRVLMPPRSFCDRDYVDTDGWVVVANEGIVETYTVVAQAIRSLPTPPYCIAYVRLDGADTAVLNYVRFSVGATASQMLSQIRVGLRVRAVFAASEECKGRITDFWFEPMEIA
jgi:uncharacterized protein